MKLSMVVVERNVGFNDFKSPHFGNYSKGSVLGTITIAWAKWYRHAQWRIKIKLDFLSGWRVLSSTKNIYI